MSDNIPALKRTIQKLKSEKKYAWSRFYKERQGWYTLFSQQRESNRTLALKIKESQALDDNDLKYLKNQFVQLMDESGKLTDCPVCFEIMKPENTAVPNCGHVICKSCKSKLDKCPTCRKDFYKGNDEGSN